jgi:hypothetical protein
MTESFVNPYEVEISELDEKVSPEEVEHVRVYGRQLRVAFHPPEGSVDVEKCCDVMEDIREAFDMRVLGKRSLKLLTNRYEAMMMKLATGPTEEVPAPTGETSDKDAAPKSDQVLAEGQPF